ncbi:hypothetical protein [Paenibacillus qinlingensis]|uniref:hypothetical protein n=1 Tax=Paenibacillus qinlingensis TaxID=1837343 RepID=UPI0015678502|nr:hypothetical protein [Paenibacillus qinlingensis]NQX57602.1 hypothetical protein [Paenibacillus qinlingensis]
MSHKKNISLSLLLFVFGLFLWNFAIHKSGEGFDNLGYGILGFAITALGIICTVASIIYLAVKSSLIEFNNYNHPYIPRRLFSFFLYALSAGLLTLIFGFVTLFILESFAK